MGRTTLFAVLGAGFCVLAALSCSGGGIGGTGITGATASVSSGVITGFGSVKLNGKEYQTQNTSFMVDGQPGTQKDLKVGMVVTVNGSLSSTGVRTATTITQDDVVEGAIQSIPVTNDRIVVLGQTVLIDTGTVFDNSIPGQNIGGLVLGDLVEVNGFVKGKGLIIATLIEKKSTPPTCQVTGIIENHSSGGQTFAIGGLTVNYNGSNFGDMPSPAVNAWNDLLVEVKGSPCDQFTITMNATKVEPERINVANADEIEVEGGITLFNSSASFMVNGVPVVTNSNATFEGGVVGDLALGVEVEVAGSLTNGVLTAKEVSFRDNVGIEGNVATVTSGGVTPNLTVSGLPGITVFVNAQTEFKGGISNLGQLLVGDHLRVRGRPTGTNTVIAAEVEKLSASAQVILEGAVQSVANPHVTMLGVLINTSPISDSNFKGPDDVAIGRTAFFTALKVGTLVKAKGILSGGLVQWSEIEIEGVDD
jgi:Domain of unknown function (DUF5666)